MADQVTSAREQRWTRHIWTMQTDSRNVYQVSNQEEWRWIDDDDRWTRLSLPPHRAHSIGRRVIETDETGLGFLADHSAISHSSRTWIKPRTRTTLSRDNAMVSLFCDNVFSKRKTNHKTPCSTRIFSKPVFIFWPIWTTSSSRWDISPRRTSPSNPMTTKAKAKTSPFFLLHRRIPIRINCVLTRQRTNNTPINIGTIAIRATWSNEWASVRSVSMSVVTKITRSLMSSSVRSSAIVARKKMEDVKHSSNEQRTRRTRRRWRVWRRDRHRRRRTATTAREHWPIDNDDSCVRSVRRKTSFNRWTRSIGRRDDSSNIFNHLLPIIIKRSSIERIETFIRCNEQVNIESRDSSFFILKRILSNLSNCRLPTNTGNRWNNDSVRQGMAVNLGEQHLIVSQEKGKQPMISILKLTSLLFSESQHDEHEYD